MQNFNSNRLNENLKREISLLIRNLKNLKDKANNFSVSRVELSGNSVAKIYVNSINGVVDVKFAIKHLNRAIGFLKREVSNKLKLKKCPEFKFIADESQNYFNHLNYLFKKIEKKIEKS